MVAERAVLLLIAALVLSEPAHAHHPGSHASRSGDGRVRVEVVAPRADDCNAIEEIVAGAPPGLSAPSGSVPVTARLSRRDGACSAGATVVRSERSLDLGPDARDIHLFVLAPDGSLAATERVPIR